MHTAESSKSVSFLAEKSHHVIHHPPFSEILAGDRGTREVRYGNMETIPLELMLMMTVS